jgi:hypothetical protein
MSLTSLPDQPWFHGTPYKLLMLAASSTVTQNREMARVFSHKPAVVTYDADRGAFKHTGPIFTGYLYQVDEEVGQGDVTVPASSDMNPGDEWVTTRPLRVRLLEETVIRPAEMMGKNELAGMLERGEIPQETYDTILAKQQLHE